MAPMDAKLRERYSRQILFGEIGEAGQERLRQSSAVIVGCGALGSALADLLVRAGVGRLRIVDRDFVEPSNLQRQTLFEESDAQELLPKAVAAERRLRSINSDVEVRGHRSGPDAGERRGVAGPFRTLAGRHRQFRNAASDQRLRGEEPPAVGLCRRGSQLGRDHADPSGRERLPGVPR